MQPYSSSGQNQQSSIYEAAADEILTEGLQIGVETAGDKGRRVGRPVTYQDNKLLFQVRFQQIQVGPQFFGQMFISLYGISIILTRLKVVMSDLDLSSHVRYPDDDDDYDD